MWSSEFSAQVGMFQVFELCKAASVESRKIILFFILALAFCISTAEQMLVRFLSQDTTGLDLMVVALEKGGVCCSTQDLSKTASGRDYNMVITSKWLYIDGKKKLATCYNCDVLKIIKSEDGKWKF